MLTCFPHLREEPFTNSATDRPHPPGGQCGALEHQAYQVVPRKGPGTLVSLLGRCSAPRCGAFSTTPCEETGPFPVDTSAMKFQENRNRAAPPLAHPFPHTDPHWPFLLKVSRGLDFGRWSGPGCAHAGWGWQLGQPSLVQPPCSA